MDWKISVALAVASFFGISSVVYLLLREDEKKNSLLRKTSEVGKVEFKIPKKCVGSVIGKRGNTIRELESKSDTVIKITDDPIDSKFKICVIRGTPECVQYAECLIQEIIVTQPQIETYEMYIPLFACGRIIGKNGESIRLIQNSTKARLTLENSGTPGRMSERKLVIKGTPEQILHAKNVVDQKIEEEKIFRSKVKTSVPHRCNHNGCKCLLVEEAPKETQNTRNYKEQNDKSLDNEEDNLIKVYLSAIESPDRFWLQKVGCWIQDLNELVDQMSDYYSKEENKKLHEVENLNLGQIVAVPDGGKWFRAKVLDIQSYSDSKEPEILLRKVDFGNTEKCKKGDLCKLKTDFLKLKFQGVECRLAKVKPRDSTWSEKAINYLKGLKHLGVRRPVEHNGRKEGRSRILSVELYDVQKSSVINVAEVLVEKGLAVWKEEQEKEEEEEEDKGDKQLEEEVQSYDVENLINDL